jgi:hypothetical protein
MATSSFTLAVAACSQPHRRDTTRPKSRPTPGCTACNRSLRQHLFAVSQAILATPAGFLTSAVTCLVPQPLSRQQAQRRQLEQIAFAQS